MSGAWCSGVFNTNSGKVINGVQRPSKKLFDKSGQLHWSLIGVCSDGRWLSNEDVSHPCPW